MKKSFQNVIETKVNRDNFLYVHKKIGINSYIYHFAIFANCFRMKSYKMTNPFFQKFCCIYQARHPINHVWMYLTHRERKLERYKEIQKERESEKFERERERERKLYIH